MRNFLQSICCLLAFILGSQVLSAQTYNFQMSSLGWATATYSGTVTNVGGSGVNVTVGITNSTGNTSSAAASPNSNGFQYNTPKIGAANNAWFLPGTTAANPLVQYVDWTALTSNVTTVITFTQPVQAVAFYIGDVDRTSPLTYVDQVTVTGKNGATTVTNPVLTKYVTSGTPSLDTVLVSGNVAYGNSTITNGNAMSTSLTTQEATVLCTFSAAVTSITIVWGQGPGATGDPAPQAYIIGDISFQKAIAPVTTNMRNTTLFNTAGLTAITPTTGTDADGSVVGYTLETLPTAAMGTLNINGIAAVAGTVYTASDIATLKFTPNTSYTGDATFTFSVTDDVGLKSNISTYTIPVDPLPAPITNNVVAPAENNSYGQTAIPALSGAVASGTIASYTINTIPAPASGILYICTPGCAPVTAGSTISEANKANLKFDPAATFTGNASFTYTANSTAGAAGNVATYTIPINNQPPIANTIISTILTNTDAADPIPALSGSDPDGTVASFNIVTLPPAGEGVLYLCTPGCATVTAGQSISLANAVNLRFDPTAGFVGTSRFTYTATDNSGNVSPAASYNVPVKGTTLVNIAPYADNIVSQQLTNADASTPIPALAGHDPEGSITSYTIVTIPAPAQGILYLCTPSCSPVTGGQVIPAASAGSLQFDPAPGFAGTGSFTYTATDNNSLVSNIANYSLPIVNVPPVANPITAPAMPNSYGQTAIPALSGHDPSTITSYTISNVPLGSGTLYLCNPTCNALSSVGTTTVLPADIGKLKFAPSGIFSGNYTFNYTATDNTGAVSQSASYTIPVINTSLDPNLPPLADNKTSAAMLNTGAQTTISALSGSDPDGTVASYVINTLPPSSAGTLFLCNPGCAAVTAGQTILAADAAKLAFKPTVGYTGNAVFNYTAVDNAGKTSAVATYTIPVTGTAPVAANVTANKMALTDGSTPIPSLSGTDQDGSIASYTITSLPPTASGILFLCTPACTPVTAGQVISTANAGSLQFDPATGYTGLFSSFNYTATDNTGRLSNNATFILPLTTNALLLPVDLISFTAEKKPGAVLLTWVAEHEVNLQSYVVERSTDGTSFDAIGTVNAFGSATQVTYHYNDDKLNTNAAVLYYRLRTVDKDGKFKYSVILNVRLDNNVKRAMTVSPNPAIDRIVVKISADIPGKTELRIVNGYGETVRRQIIDLVKGDNFFFINDLNKQASGVYTVQTALQGRIMVQKIIISR